MDDNEMETRFAALEGRTRAIMVCVRMLALDSRSPEWLRHIREQALLGIDDGLADDAEASPAFTDGLREATSYMLSPDDDEAALQ